MEPRSRSIRFDFLKALAILSVIFYHIGTQQYGYLGVDIFFVVGGYFLGRSLIKAADSDKFSYFSFLLQKILRLWPLVMIAAAASTLIGLFTMLPDDFENLGQSVVASNVFLNNILSAITTQNYWDVVNEFKPLMHTWYLGVLVQSYLIFALAAKLSSLSRKNTRRLCLIGFSGISVLSVVLYLLPVFSAYEKFYYVPTRLFELGIGAIIASLDKDVFRKFSFLTKKRTFALSVEIILFSAITALMIIPVDFMAAPLRLLLVCLLTGLLVFIIQCDPQDWNFPVITQLSLLGKASYSFFIWHQVIVAFIKYIWCTKLGFVHIVFALAVIFGVSFCSYMFIEKPLDAIVRDKAKRLRLLAVCIVGCVVISSAGFLINARAGVVRNVPELDIVSDNISSGMHAAYCDRVYDYNKDFTDDGKVKVLVLGNSFGRDFSNILLESEYADSIQLSYATDVNKAGQNRIVQADYIFFVIFGNDFSELPEPLTVPAIEDKVVVVGNKNFGDNNGNIYNRRHRDDYWESSIALSDDYFEQNKRLREQFGDSYIDLITPIQKEDGTIRVFTADRKFISQDCRHLTAPGAVYYAEILDLSFLTER